VVLPNLSRSAITNDHSHAHELIEHGTQNQIHRCRELMRGKSEEKNIST